MFTNELFNLMLICFWIPEHITYSFKNNFKPFLSYIYLLCIKLYL